MAVTTPTIRHTPEEEWQAGARVPIFTIVNPILDEAGNPVMIDDPEDDQALVENREPRQVAAMHSVEYTMPEKPNSGLALKFLKMARTLGAEVALGWIFELAIGEEAYDDLSNETDLDPDLLASLMLKVQQRALGGLEGPKGR